MIREEMDSFVCDDEESTRSYRRDLSNEISPATPRLNVVNQPCLRIPKNGYNTRCFSPSSLRNRDLEDDDDTGYSVADKMSLLKNTAAETKYTILL